MTTSRKRRRSRSAPPLPEPSDNQMFEAMIAFSALKACYRLEHLPHAPPSMRYVVKVSPVSLLSMNSNELEDDLAIMTGTIHRFTTEQAARQWRETEIIRETVKVAMRTRP